MQNPHPPPPLHLAPTGKKKSFAEIAARWRPKTEWHLLRLIGSCWCSVPPSFPDPSRQTCWCSFVPGTDFYPKGPPLSSHENHGKSLEKSWGRLVSRKKNYKKWMIFMVFPSKHSNKINLSWEAFSTFHPSYPIRKKAKKTPNYNDSDHLRASLIQQDQSSESFQCRYHFPSGYLRGFFSGKNPKKASEFFLRLSLQ